METTHIDRTKALRQTIETSVETLAAAVDEVRSSRYIALWQGDSKSLRGSLERIAKTARDIIDDVEAVADRKAVA